MVNYSYRFLLSKSIHCDFELIHKEKKICVECGADLEDVATICSKCGCPIEEEKPVVSVTPQQVEVMGIKITQKSKQIICIIAAAVAVLPIAIFGIQHVKKIMRLKKLRNSVMSIMT